MAIPRRYLLLAVALAAVAPASVAQPSRSEPKLSIQGYDAVAYFTLGRAERGNEAYSSVWDGRRYLFMSEKHRGLFAANPEKYAPQFAGHCASAMSDGVLIEPDPVNWIISDGRLFLFAGASGPDKMRSDPAMATRADANWPKLH